MKTLILQENNEYNFRELLDIFECDDTNLIEILNILSRKRIVQINKNNIINYDLQNLSFNQTNIYVNDTFNFRYVGVIYVLDTILIIYPKYIDNYLEDASNGYIFLNKILNVIKKYYDDYQSLNYSDSYDTCNLNEFSLLITILNDFLENGLYSRDVSIIQNCIDGEINWEQTMENNISYTINNQIWYLDYYSQIIKQEKSYINQLHIYVIKEIYNKLKDILDILNYPTINLPNESIINFDDSNYIINMINLELGQQFNTHKIRILELLRTYFLNCFKISEEENLRLYGTSNFNIVWEDVCRKYYQFKMNLNFYNLEKISPIIKDLDNNTEYVLLNAFRPDFILSNKEQEFFIFDAKYYKVNINEICSIMSINDISKQFIYELLVREVNTSSKIYNFLVFPTVLESKEFATIKYDIFKDLSPIKLILLNSIEAFDIYLN